MGKMRYANKECSRQVFYRLGTYGADAGKIFLRWWKLRQNLWRYFNAHAPALTSRVGGLCQRALVGLFT